MFDLQKAASIHAYVESTALIALVTALGFITAPVLHPTNINIVYLLGVLFLGLRWGRRPAIFAAVLSAFVFAFCFVPPRFRFAVSDLAYVTTFAGFLVVAVATSELASRARELATRETARTRADARSEAKDEILYRISHELRAPLAAVLGWAEVASHPDTNLGRLNYALDRLTHSGQRLERLVHDLVTASRINSGKLPVDLQPTTLDRIVAVSVGDMMSTAEQKGVEMELAIEPAGLVLADAQRIDQIVTNLLSNAIKFTPSGGLVLVRLHQAGPNAELIVSDSGVGIPEEFLSRVFEPFSQPDGENAKNGLGLGLSIVKHLVSAHGGTISVASEGKGRGTTFIVRLPTVAVEQASPSK